MSKIEINLKEFNRASQKRRAFNAYIQAALEDKPLESRAARLTALDLHLGEKLTVAANLANESAATAEASFAQADKSKTVTADLQAAIDGAAHITAEKDLRIEENAARRGVKYLAHITAELAKTTDPRKKLQLLRELRKKCNR